MSWVGVVLDVLWCVEWLVWLVWLVVGCCCGGCVSMVVLWCDSGG